LEYQSDREYYSIRADGTGQHKQHYQARWRIAYSPSGKYLVQRRPMGGSETDDVISVASRQVVLDLADYVDLEPLYAWLGERLACVLPDEVFVHDLIGSERERIGGGGQSPLGSTDGRYLAYERAGQTWLVDLSSGTQRPIGTGRPRAWSFDCKRLCVCRDEALVVITIASAAELVITPIEKTTQDSRSLVGADPQWAEFSPAGNLVASVEHGEGASICRWSPRSKKWRTLTTGAMDEIPTVHAVQGWIAFHRNGNEVWVIDEDGGNAARVALGGYPRWFDTYEPTEKPTSLAREQPPAREQQPARERPEQPHVDAKPAEVVTSPVEKDPASAFVAMPPVHSEPKWPAAEPAQPATPLTATDVAGAREEIQKLANAQAALDTATDADFKNREESEAEIDASNSIRRSKAMLARVRTDVFEPLLDDEDRHVRRWAAAMLIYHRGEPAARQILSERDGQTILPALRWIAHNKPAWGYDALAVALECERAETTWEIVYETLVGLDAARTRSWSFDVLVERLNRRSDDRDRSYIWAYLFDAHESSATNIARSQPNQAEREHAAIVRGLVAHGDKRDVEAWIEAIEHWDSVVREQALDRLLATDVDQAVATVRDYLNGNPERMVLYGLVHRLRTIRHAGAFRALLDALLTGTMLWATAKCLTEWIGYEALDAGEVATALQDDPPALAAFLIARGGASGTDALVSWIESEPPQPERLLPLLVAVSLPDRRLLWPAEQTLSEHARDWIVPPLLRAACLRGSLPPSNAPLLNTHPDETRLVAERLITSDFDIDRLVGYKALVYIAGPDAKAIRSRALEDPSHRVRKQFEY